MAAQPTPETLEMQRMLFEDVAEPTILNYLNRHTAHIDIHYTNNDNDSDFLDMALGSNYRKLAIRLLDLGAQSMPSLDNLTDYFDEGLQPPLALSKELMLKLIEKGFSKDDMLLFLCMHTNGIHNNLLPFLWNLGGVNINYRNADGYTPLGMLLIMYGPDRHGDFVQMLRFLIGHGANPNIPANRLGHDAYTIVDRNEDEIRNPNSIRRILDSYRPPAAQPQQAQQQQAPAAVDYNKLWWEELGKIQPNLQKIREYAPHVNINGKKGGSKDIPLLISIRKKNLELLKTLLDLGANPNELVDGFFVWMYGIADTVEIGPHLTSRLTLLEELRKKGAKICEVIQGENAFSYALNILGQYEKIIAYFDYFKLHCDIKQLINGKNILENVLMSNMTCSVKENLAKYLIDNGVSYDNVMKRLPYNCLLNKKIILDYVFEKTGDGDYIAENMMKSLNTLSDKRVLNKTDTKIIINNVLSYNPDVNKVYSDGSTMLIRMAKLSQKIDIEMFRKVLERGANIQYKNPAGKTSADYATDDEIKELLNPNPQPKIPWTGFSKADIAFTNEVFHQVTHAQDLAIANPNQVLFSMCPVCLKYVEHATGSCMYMTHSCVEQAGFQGYYHKKLWAAYSYKKQLYDAQGAPTVTKRMVEWCTLCGRICKGHRHYKLSTVFAADGKTIAPLPSFAGEGDYFAVDCSKPSIGGGGIKEKVNRYRRFREVALFLNQQVGTELTFDEAINTLVEEIWEAPLATRRLEVNYALRKKEYNAAVRNELFPVPQAEPEPNYANIAYPNASNTSLHPLVFAKADGEHRNVMEHLSGDDENIVQFRHRMADGTINEHAGPNQQIALDNLMGYLRDMATKQTSADFGLCWQHADLYLTTLADAAHPPPKCTARLYPAEVLAAIEGATYTSPAKKEEDMKVYNAYRVAFNKKFGGAQGGRRRQQKKTRKHHNKLRKYTIRK